VNPQVIASMGSRRTTLLALGAGNLLEWYDWLVYGLLAPLLAPHFFPSSSALSSTLSALAVFAVGFAARPLGGAIFGTVADRVGRRGVMLLSVAGMAISGFVIAIVPTYDVIGSWAGIVLLACRLVQGLSTGVESPLTSAYAVELAPEGRISWYGGILGAFVQLGQLSASLVSLITSASLDSAAMAAWGWRVPFAVGAVGGLGVVWLRTKLPETLQSAAATAEPQERMSVNEVWRAVSRNKLSLLAIVFVVARAQVFNYAWAVGLPSVAKTTYHENPTAIFAVTTLDTAVLLLLSPIAGWAADKYRLSRVFVQWRLIAVPVAFLMLFYHKPGIGTLAMIMFVGGIVQSVNLALHNTVSATLMPRNCRVAGVGIAFAVGVAAFGGTASYLLVWLNGKGLLPVFSIYTAVLCILSVAIYRLAVRRGCLHAGE
jgi:MHS family alpha-ketoglutarate permease-like MFS transporter